MKNDQDEHFKEVLNTIDTLVNGLNHRKQSMGGVSNVSIVSQTKRTTDAKPFTLSRSNSRRTKDVLRF